MRTQPNSIFYFWYSAITLTLWLWLHTSAGKLRPLTWATAKPSNLMEAIGVLAAEMI